MPWAPDHFPPVHPGHSPWKSPQTPSSNSSSFQPGGRKPCSLSGLPPEATLPPPADEYAFMGALIIQEVVRELLGKGLSGAKVLLLAGSR